MAKLYSNENVSLRIVEALRSLGHDVLTSYDARNANQETPDGEVLAFAHIQNRIVLTNNRKDFIRLHRQPTPHSGIVVYTVHPDSMGVAQRVSNGLKDPLASGRFLLRVHAKGFSFDS